MEERQRIREATPSSDQTEDVPATNRLLEARALTDQLLRAGEEAIRRALSGNSEQFLLENQQVGGQ